MREKIDFIGRNYSDNEKSTASKVINAWENIASEKIEGETEKSPYEKQVIAKLKDILDTELKTLGIENYNILNENNIHLLTTDLYQREFPKHPEHHGHYTSTDRSIFLNKDKTDTNIRFVSTLLHEMIHSISRQKFYFDNKKNITDARVGYRIHSKWKEDSRSSRFTGFNEVMTDYTVCKLLSVNIKNLADLNIKKEDLNSPIYSYLGNYQLIVDNIVEKIAEDKNITPWKAFNKLEAGQFENTILALKDLDRLFGEGSLEILGYLGEFEGEKMTIMDNLIKKYFSKELVDRDSLVNKIKLLISS